MKTLVNHWVDIENPSLTCHRYSLAKPLARPNTHLFTTCISKRFGFAIDPQNYTTHRKKESEKSRCYRYLYRRCQVRPDRQAMGVHLLDPRF